MSRQSSYWIPKIEQSKQRFYRVMERQHSRADPLRALISGESMWLYELVDLEELGTYES